MNTQEFNTSFAQLNPMLFSFAMSMTRNTTDAKDLMQETALRAYQHLDRFESGSNFKAWVTTIMRNYFISTCRKKKTRNRVLAPIDDFLFAVENKGTSAEVSSTLLKKELEGLLNKLSEEHRTPFLLHHRGFHYDEISKQMNIPMGTVKSRIYFAKKKLRTMIVQHYGEELRVA
jgi:RNA polymerase sigma-70 factor (ECF subfamily)